MPIWHAFPPELNVGSMVGYVSPPLSVPPVLIPSPPGVGTIVSAAKSYAESGIALLEAAVGTQAAMDGLGETYRGESGELVQAAFRNHTNWLSQQSQAAEKASAVLYSLAAEFSGAQSAMEVVGGLLYANKLEETALLLTNGSGQNTFELLLNHLAYAGIWTLAAGVMDAYAGAVMPTLEALPPPALSTPIVTDPGIPPPPPQFEVPVYTPKSGTPQQFNTTTTNNNNTATNNNTTTNNNTNTTNNNTGDTNTGNTDTGNTPTDTTQSPTQPATADPSEVTSPLSDSGSYGGTDGSDWSAGQQPGFYGTSPNSPTLAGLNGGAGSLVALNLARGGFGSMPGASTGFRMPSNWLRGPGTAYGASSNPTGGAGPAGRGAPRRGAIAPKAQMRRRRDEERKPGKVFVPGEELEVPVLEKPPVIGVIEYADERPEDVVAEGDSLVGILERSDDPESSDAESAVAEPEPAR
ncbi:PPE domain-containing protein [Nocardia sp. NPDC005998]|uniref:PPE domain-containing protein n=1 Tax=Nocardia sp. NPDC005998 TaxID=3156894 RepID=UPI0033BBB98B